MYCSECGQKLPDTAKFCSGCGTTVNGGPVAEAPASQTSRPPLPAQPGRSASTLASTSASTPPTLSMATDWLKQNRKLIWIAVGVLLLVAGTINYLQRSSQNNMNNNQPGPNTYPAVNQNQPGVNDNAAINQQNPNAVVNQNQPGMVDNTAVNQQDPNAAVNQPGMNNNTAVNQPANADAAFRQWWNNASAFYQEYARLNQEYDSVTRKQGATPQESTAAYARMVQGFQAMYGQLGRIQPPAGVSQEDAADMAQVQKIWANLLTTEVQVGQQYLQYAQQGQNPPAQFLKVTMPQLMQTRNASAQQLQQVVARMTARHQQASQG